MSVLDPKQDAAALEPLINKAEAEAIDAVVNRVVPALSAALKQALVGAFDGLTITVSITKKDDTKSSN